MKEVREICRWKIGYKKEWNVFAVPWNRSDGRRLGKKGKNYRKGERDQKRFHIYICNDAMLCASCNFCLVCSDNSSPVVNGCKEKALYTPVPCTRFLLNIESRNWVPMYHIINVHLTNKAMRQEGIKPGILLSWCNDKVRAARSYRSQTADEGCCSPLEIGIAGKLPRFHVVSRNEMKECQYSVAINL